MEESVKQRLVTFIKSQGISVHKFERICGFSVGYVGHIRVSIQPDKVMIIAHNFPSLNTAWLLTGDGSMLKDELSMPNSESSQVNAALVETVRTQAETIRMQAELIRSLQDRITAYEREKTVAARQDEHAGCADAKSHSSAV